MKVECLLLVKNKDDLTESSAQFTVSGRTKDCLKIVAMLKRRYGKENVL